MDVERGVDDLLGLLGEVADRVAALEGASEEVDGSEVAGAGPQAAENRNVRAAQAVLARQRARRMREGLAEIRAQAQRMAALAREASPSLAASTAAPVDVARDAARAFADADDRAGVLAVLLRHAVAALPGGGRAGICSRGPGDVPVAETTADALVAELLEAQEVDGGGPVATVAAGGPTVRVADLRTDRRWPELARRAAPLGVRSLVVRGLPGPRSGAVALALGGAEAGAAGAAAADVERLVDQAEIALAGVARGEGLRRALISRDVIGQAKGILVHRDGIAPDEAFARLVAASQGSNIKLHDVAAWLIDDVRRERSHPLA